MTINNSADIPSDVVRAVLVEVHRDFLRFLTRRMGNADEAADVLHEFYVKVLSRIDDVRDPDKLRAWMRRVLETTLIDYYRAQGRKRRTEANYQYLEVAHVVGEDSAELDSVICTCLYKLLPTLKPEYADVLWRADLVGESRTVSAAELKITETNLRVRLHRARQALKQRLEEVCRTCPIHGYFDCNCEYSQRQRLGIKQGSGDL